MPKLARNPQLTDLSTLPREAFIREPDVRRLWPVSKATMSEYVRVGKFIKPTRIGKRATAWRLGDVLDWLEKQEQRIAKND